MRRWGTIFAVFVALLTSGQAWAQDVAHHITKVHIDPVQSHVLVHDVIEFDGEGEVTLNLSTEFQIAAANLNGKVVTLNRDRDRLSLELPTAGRQTLDIVYQSQRHAMVSPEGGLIEPDWLAQPDDYLATWSIDGTTPQDQKFIIPGKLMFETKSNGQYRANFQNFTPSALPLLISGPFHVDEKMVGEVRIRTYFHEELKPLARPYLNDTARYIEYYVGKVGPYPYPGFSIISGPAPVGWGLPGMTYMGRRVLALPFIRHTSLPHEVLHNWWGNAVEVDYAGGNWAEGLTTYMADHAIADSAKAGGGKEKRMEWLRNYAALPSDRDHALNAFRSKTHDASQVVGYGKTAFVFHMLKTQLGSDVFDKAIQRFNRDNHLKVAGWPEIQAAFERESGKKLGAFFDTWIERPGAPELKIVTTNATDSRVEVTLEQVQTGAHYSLQLPIRIETANGAEQHTAYMRKKRQTFTFVTKSEAGALHIDPNADVFRRLNTDETPPILRDVTLDPNTKLMALGTMEMRTHARELASRLLQARLRMQDPLDPAQTVIIAGPKAAVRAHLVDQGLADAPAEVSERGDARAWTARTNGGPTYLIVEAEDGKGFNALTRVLPHYKRRSYVIMESGKTVDKGTWESPQNGPLSVEF